MHENKNDDREQLLALHFCALGALLPPVAEEWDVEAESTAKVVIDEMHETQAEIDAMLGLKKKNCREERNEIVSVPEFREH